MILYCFVSIFVRSVLTFLEVVFVSNIFQVFQWNFLRSRAKTCGQSSSWNTHLNRLVKKFSLQIKQPMVDIKDYLLKSLIPWSKARLLRTTSTNLNRIPYQFSCQTSSCKWSEDQKKQKHCKLPWHTSACLQECALARCQGVQPCRSLQFPWATGVFWMSIFLYAKPKKRAVWVWGSGFRVEC